MDRVMFPSSILLNSDRNAFKFRKQPIFGQNLIERLGDGDVAIFKFFVKIFFRVFYIGRKIQIHLNFSSLVVNGIMKTFKNSGIKILLLKISLINE